MAVKGNVKEFNAYTLKVGLFRAKVIAINPTLEQITTFQDISNMKEPEYVTEYTDNTTEIVYPKAIITVWFRVVDSNGEDTEQVFSKNFNLINKISVSKTGKIQYINDIGTTTWANDKEALKDSKFSWFTKRSFREALLYEATFYEFLQKWLSLDWRDPETELSFDAQDFFKGKFKELQKLVPMFKTNFVCPFATIHTKVPAPTDENPNPAPKFYQSIYDKFLPGNTYASFPDEIKIKPKFIQDFIDEMAGEYGCKDYYGKYINGKVEVSALRDYDPTENPISTGNTKHEDSNTSNTSTSTANNIGISGEVIDDLPF